ncbi:MAG: 3-deoxy-8-phosphooctulonate synthase [Spirochaetes bacterium]|nr:3-deoxy-8-phosphooctulonate synthase [Spirochaetota bacterium]
MNYCGYKINSKQRFFLIAGPCVIESRDMIIKTAEILKKICEKLDLFLIFKSSYDKANRSSISSYRGPGLVKGLKILSEVRETFNIPVLTDVHSIEEIADVSQVADVLQIPAFLCRQTDLLISAAKSGKPVNVKKGQFVAPRDTANIVEKLKANGCKSYAITERGYSFGYNNLVVDMRSFAIIRSLGIPVIFDATHSTQLPGGGLASGGEREFAPLLARSAVAAGIDGLFMEVHESPDKALCDATNQYYLHKFEELLKMLIVIDEAVKE